MNIRLSAARITRSIQSRHCSDATWRPVICCRRHTRSRTTFSTQSKALSTINFTFNGTYSGTALSDFLLGRMSGMTTSAPSDVPAHKWYHGLYAQDTWKVSRRLTANLGVRWEPFLAETMNNGAIYNFSFEKFKQGIRSTVYKNAPAGLSYPGDPGFQGNSGVKPRFNQFAPRIGLAFDPSGSGATSIRASFGNSRARIDMSRRPSAVGSSNP